VDVAQLYHAVILFSDIALSQNVLRPAVHIV